MSYVYFRPACVCYNEEVKETQEDDLFDAECAEIENEESLTTLSKCPRLCTVLIAGNPVTRQSEFNQHCLGQTISLVL